MTRSWILCLFILHLVYGNWSGLPLIFTWLVLINCVRFSVSLMRTENYIYEEYACFETLKALLEIDWISASGQAYPCIDRLAYSCDQGNGSCMQYILEIPSHHCRFLSLLFEAAYWISSSYNSLRRWSPAASSPYMCGNDENTVFCSLHRWPIRCSVTMWIL